MGNSQDGSAQASWMVSWGVRGGMGGRTLVAVWFVVAAPVTTSFAACVVGAEGGSICFDASTAVRLAGCIWSM